MQFGSGVPPLGRDVDAFASALSHQSVLELCQSLVRATGGNQSVDIQMLVKRVAHLMNDYQRLANLGEWDSFTARHHVIPNGTNCGYVRRLFQVALGRAPRHQK